MQTPAVDILERPAYPGGWGFSSTSGKKCVERKGVFHVTPYSGGPPAPPAIPTFGTLPDLTETQPGSGLNVGIFAINYKESDIGAFHEYYLIVAAKDRPIESRPLPAERSLGYFVWDIELDSELALRFGRQVWGYPKTYADGKVGWTADAFAFEFKERSGRPIYSGSCGGCESLPFEFVRFPPFVFITPYEERRSWAKAINEGASAGRAYDPEKDKLEWNPDSRMGSKLSRIGFKPVYWTLGRNVSAVGFK